MGKKRKDAPYAQAAGSSVSGVWEALLLHMDKILSQKWFRKLQIKNIQSKS